uniref:Kynurenine 3-monooxygenase n=1 Tax=Phallusia mammillata TaxID=59560 RepID=A0A6F9DGK9_9ASCI|nr:kynurenine 3-monooxygenase [Phallusia mammillata]
MADGKRVTIVGGGPVGALNACYLSKKGYIVDLYESRSDIRKTENAVGRSINLALSLRGIEALKEVGLDEKVKALGIPMRARMIHLVNGKCYPVPYGKSGQHLLSVDRMKLNRDVLSAASEFPNVDLHFNHKFVSCDLATAKSTFVKTSPQLPDKEEVTITSDAIFGCDGAHSAVRRQLQKRRFDYSQQYIPHGYKELTIPPTEDGKYAMPANYLHIWPRHEFMLIALPNQDMSFTCTLFMAFSIFDTLTTEQKVLDFFREVFPSAVDLIGEELLKTDFFLLPPLPMVTVKASPYHYKDKVVLFGDAAHACVPFYGQGLNAGLEDVLVFHEILEKHNYAFDVAFSAFSEQRSKDGHAVADLSHQNYIEMRSSVTSSWFLFRKKVDSLLSFLCPSVFTPKYEMVAFTRTPYHKVIEKSELQYKYVNYGLAALCVLMFIGGSRLAWKAHKGELHMSELPHLESLLAIKNRFQNLV